MTPSDVANPVRPQDNPETATPESAPQDPATTAEESAQPTPDENSEPIPGENAEPAPEDHAGSGEEADAEAAPEGSGPGEESDAEAAPEDPGPAGTESFTVLDRVPEDPRLSIGGPPIVLAPTAPLLPSK